jgi:hypothetical protein
VIPPSFLEYVDSSDDDDDIPALLSDDSDPDDSGVDVDEGDW